MTIFQDASAKAIKLNQESLKPSKRATSNFRPVTTERRKANKQKLVKRKRHVLLRTAR